jgi:hypothetical protein
MIDREFLQKQQQLSVCDYQTVLVKRIEISHTKAQSHGVTVGVQNFEPLHFCLLLETVTKNESVLASNSSFLTGL